MQTKIFAYTLNLNIENHEMCHLKTDSSRIDSNTALKDTSEEHDRITSNQQSKSNEIDNKNESTNVEENKNGVKPVEESNLFTFFSLYLLK